MSNPVSNPMYFPPAPFDLNAAVTCSDLVDIAYAMYAQWVAQDKPGRDGGFDWQAPKGNDFLFGPPIWGNSKVLLRSDWEPFALVAHRGNQAWAIFRGTESIEDWYKDAQAHQTDYALPNIRNVGKVHKGHRSTKTCSRAPRSTSTLASPSATPPNTTASPATTPTTIATTTHSSTPSNHRAPGHEVS